MPMNAVSPEDIKAQRAAGWPDFHPEAFCHLCGQRNIPGGGWWVDSDRFNLATADLPRKELEILCPTCFVRRWMDATGLKANWHLVPEQIRHGSNE